MQMQNCKGEMRWRRTQQKTRKENEEKTIKDDTDK